jgi:GxxExxY protein
MDDGEVYFDDDDEPDPDLNRITNAVIGAAVEVHKRLGAGLHESLYQRAMEVELGLRHIPFRSQVECNVVFKGVVIGKGIMDLLVDEKVIVELKTVDEIGKAHVAQVMNYMKVTRHRLSLILNFHAKRLIDGVRRVAL